MMRPRSFVVLDTLITLPVLVVCVYSFFLGRDAPGEWFWWIFIACGLAVLLPSLAYLFGKTLGRGFVAALVSFYLLMLPVLFYGLFYKLHTGAMNVFTYCVLILAVGKSLYSACVVSKSP